MIGCVIMSEADGKKYITSHYDSDCDIPKNILPNIMFVRIHSIDDVYRKCVPLLRYMRETYGPDHNLFMVEPVGITYIGNQLCPEQESYGCWLKKSELYKKELDYLNCRDVIR